MASLVEQAKKTAAFRAVDEYIAPHVGHTGGTPLVVGIGSGSTIVYAVERLIEVVSEANKATTGAKGREVVCIPTSFQAAQLIQDAPEGLLQLGDLGRYSPPLLLISPGSSLRAN
jgi:ribose 5-phosphate isomerase A